MKNWQPMKLKENMDTTHTSASSWWRTSSFGVSFAREQLLDWKDHMKLVLSNKIKCILWNHA